MRRSLLAWTCAFVLLSGTVHAAQHFVRVAAKNKYERSAIVDLGISVDTVTSDSVYATVSDAVLEKLQKSPYKILETFVITTQYTARDFPPEDSKFHNYDEITKALDDLVAKNPKVLHKFSIGKTLQGREIWCVQVNTSKVGIGKRDVGMKPGVLFVGNHHAREHVSAEIPLMLLQYLMDHNGSDPQITNLVKTRDIYFIPMLNADGVEYDISGGEYHMHRKNMRKNGDRSTGVDLNRNYGFMWNHGGASDDPSDETYHGPTPFSEPETQAVKAFVESKLNLRMLLSFHTFSELILYPWGHSNDPIGKSIGFEKDRKVYETMAKTMANWNGYTPEQASDLYIASGDTTDWAYSLYLKPEEEAHRIFAFTFELSPKDMGGGGFYPGQGVLDRVFEANLKPALYMIDLADDPYRALKPFDPMLTWLL